MQRLLKPTQTCPLLSSSVVSYCPRDSYSFISSSHSPASFAHLPGRFIRGEVGISSSQTKLLSMCSAAAITLIVNGVSLSESSVRKKGSYHSNVPVCRCVGGATTRLPFRSWVVAGPAWFCTVAGSVDGCSTVSAAAAAVTDGMLEEGEGKSRKGLKIAVAEDKVLGRFNKRTKCGELDGTVDLLTIPGVGPKNLQKLVGKGFRGMAELKQLYKEKFLGKSHEKMVEYLQTSVGIIHRNHAESITTFIKESVDEELKDSRSETKKRITFCVEGNISVGKTTFLQKIVSDTIELRDLVEVVPEPIDKWQDIGPDHFNILDAFYAEPHRYAYTFQNYVFVTRVMQERESSGGLKPLRLMERSVFSDRMVFVRAVHEARWMNEMEISIYDSWFDPVVSVLPGLIPDGFIYLRASPDTCHQRMKHRKREEEGGVSLDYLRDLHDKHENWLFPSQSGNHGVLSVSKPLLMDNSLHPDIRGKVFYLQGDHMHSSIQKVPALVLDCEANIDLNRDIEAKEHYARQVSEFFKYVKSMKDVSCVNSNESRPIVLPHEGGLLLPNGKPFPNSALKSLDFRQAFSFMQ